MILSTHGREYYQLTLTTDPVTAPTDWEASFDGGSTWVAAVDVGGRSAWLVAGPDAPPATPAGEPIRANMHPLVRLAVSPELVVRDAPRITLT